MVDPVQLRPKTDVHADREALEHIARAVQGRVLRGPGSLSPAGALGLETLSLSRASIEALLEAMPAAIGILAHGDLVHANAAFAYAFGYRSFDELASAGGLEAIVPGGVALLNAGAHNGRERTVAVEALTRGRRRLKISFDVKSLAGELELLRLVDGATLDAETPATAPQPQAVPEAEEANEESDAAAVARRLDFLAKVSHEVRTPLNSILGFTELMLEERLGAIGNPRYRGYVEDIHQSGLYALSLLNDLLDISKIDAGKFDLDFTAVDLPELVEACVNSLQPLAKRERILLRTSLAPNLPAVIADRRRLKQILLNLLSNAIKFTNAGGQVIVSARVIEGGDLRLRVHDTGVGMTEDEVAAAMQPFHQLDTAPRKQTGTGLGLPVTKALVEANRARLLIASERGAGTSADVIFAKDRLAAP
ncbi:MAG TPA: ATP-binding protein [Methyloceanibacter sp.]|nr:ATP-binding protein [Methyloceanibacter sp.]